VEEGLAHGDEERSVWIRWGKLRAQCGDLRHNCCWTLIDRTDNEHLCGAVTVPPNRHGLLVDAGEGLEARQRIQVAACLHPWVDLLARLPATLAEVAVVVEKDDEPRVVKDLGKRSVVIPIVAEVPCAMTTAGAASVLGGR
jgi:hypothetical protein